MNTNVIKKSTKSTTFHLSYSALPLFVVVSNHLDNLSIPNMDWNVMNGVKKEIDFTETVWDDRLVKVGQLYDWTKMYQRKYKPSRKG